MNLQKFLSVSSILLTASLISGIVPACSLLQVNAATLEKNLEENKTQIYHFYDGIYVKLPEAKDFSAAIITITFANNLDATVDFFPMKNTTYQSSTIAGKTLTLHIDDKYHIPQREIAFIVLHSPNSITSIQIKRKHDDYIFSENNHYSQTHVNKYFYGNNAPSNVLPDMPIPDYALPPTPGYYVPDPNRPVTMLPDMPIPDYSIPPTPVYYVPEPNQPRDLGGLVVTLASWADKVEPEEKANSYEEAVWEYRHEMMDKHNFQFEEKSLINWNTALEKMSTTTLAGEPSAEIYRFHPLFLDQVMESGLAADLSKSDVIDWSKPKWNDVAIQMATDGDAIYGLAVGFEPRKGLYFNKRLFKESGLDPDLLYDLQASGEWTWRKFEEICYLLTRDINNDEVNDVYAYAIQPNHFLEIAILSNNGFVVGKDENGKYYNNLNSPNTIEAMRWCMNLWRQDYDLFPRGEGNFLTQNALFQDGKVAMHIADEWEAANYSKTMADDYGFVCFPKGPKATQYAVGQSDDLWVIPNTYSQKEVDDILFALDVWTSTPPGYSHDEAWMIGSYPHYRDDRAVNESNVLMREPGVQRVDYKNFLGNKVNLDLGDKIFWRGDTPTEVIESIADQMDAALSELNAE